jgi:hypothetical protein
MPRRDKPWERGKGESSIAYQAFLAYRDLGPFRTLDRAYQSYPGRKMGVKGATGRASGRFYSYFATYAWEERAAAWDAHIQAQRDLVAAAEARKWERRRQKSLETNWEAAQKIRGKFEAMIAWPITRKFSRDGKTVFEPARWSFQTAALLARQAAELEAATLLAVASDPDELTDVEARATAEEPIEGEAQED